MKKLILNADDFGLSSYHNLAILKGYQKNLLFCASLLANGEKFDEAINEIIPKCSNLDLAVHLNIMEGYALTDCPMLTDKNGKFNKSYAYFLFNQHNKKLLAQIEQEFRAQIEKILQYKKPSRLDSHVHTHGICEIFKICCILAKEYDIPYIRTQHEQLYFVPKTILKPINLIKVLLLNYLTYFNKKTIKKYNLKTNAYTIGIGYTGMMNINTIKYGIKNLKNETIEIIIHPSTNPKNNSNFEEFQIIQNQNLIQIIKSCGYDLI